jgi:hypothetical protein
MTLVGGSGIVTGVTELDAVEAVLVPIALAASTVNVYGVPFVSPVIEVLGQAPLTVAVFPSGSEVILYWVIELPPSAVGALQLTEA